MISFDQPYLPAMTDERLSVANTILGRFFKFHTREMILMLKVNISLQLF